MNSDESTFCQGYHIMVVDDEETVAKFLTEMLKIRGCHVTTHNNSREAMEYFQTNMHSVDLVITDQTMPNMTGVELTQSMLISKPELPIFLLTGYSEEINFDKAIKLGIREFITKPLKLAELSEKLKKHLPPKLINHRTASES